MGWKDYSYWFRGAVVAVVVLVIVGFIMPILDSNGLCKIYLGIGGSASGTICYKVYDGMFSPIVFISESFLPPNYAILNIPVIFFVYFILGAIVGSFYQTLNSWIHPGKKKAYYIRDPMKRDKDD